MAAYGIVWSPAANASYYRILIYLEERWTIKELNDFINCSEELIHQISDNPLLYPFSQGSEIHKCVVVKQVSLFYRIKASSVELLLFWDNRQDPKKLLL